MMMMMMQAKRKKGDIKIRTGTKKVGGLKRVVWYVCREPKVSHKERRRRSKNPNPTKKSNLIRNHVLASDLLFALLRADLFLGPSRKTSVALDGESVTAVATAEATDAGRKASESVLLRGLR